MPADRPRILVTDAGRGSAIAVIRSLGRRGWPVAAADFDHRSPGFSSRYVAARVTYPDPARHATEAAERISAAVDRLGIDLVVPVTDETILPLSAIRADLERRTRLALPSAQAIAVTADKSSTFELAARLGVPVPRSVPLAGSDDARQVGDRLGWPVVVKPCRSRSFAKDGTIARHLVSYASTSDELEAAARKGPAIAQEYVQGTGHGVELLLRSGEVIAAFQHRRIREVPVTGGASSYRESVALDPELLEYSVALLRFLDWTGVAMVEFRVGPTGPRLMEVNGRLWGSLPLAVRAGVDFPGLLADVHLGRAVDAGPLGRYALGVRSRSLPLEVSWIGAVLSQRPAQGGLATPRRRDALKVAAQLLVPFGWDVLARDDPAPGLREIARVAVGSVRRLLNATGEP